jgi:hypothetical protein
VTGRRGTLLACVAALVALAALVAAVAAAAPPNAPLPRATHDRPDDLRGSQIHLVYVLPRDGTDRQLDTDGQIANSVAAFQRWMAGQTGGRDFRIDTYRGRLDISFFRLAETDSQVRSHDPYIRDLIEHELEAAGMTVPGKIYGVWYDGSSSYACGGGAWPPALPGIVGALYLHGEPPGAPGCDTNPFAQQGGQPSYIDFAMAHELLHTMGFVPTCAPHQTRGGHVSDSPTDLLYAGDEPWQPSVLDYGHDDYYDAHIPGCLDLANSPFLTRAVGRMRLGRPALVRRRSLRLRVACLDSGSDCRTSVSVWHGHKRVAVGSVALSAGASETLTVRLSRAARSLLGRHHRLSITIRAPGASPTRVTLRR